MSPTMCGFLRPPPQTIQSFGGSGRRVADFKIAAADTAAVRKLQAFHQGQGEIVSVERFRAGFFKERVLEITLDDPAVHTTLAGDDAACVERHATLARDPLVDQRISRPCVEGDRIAGCRHIGDVGNTADIDEYHRVFVVELSGKRAREP